MELNEEEFRHKISGYIKDETGKPIQGANVTCNEQLSKTLFDGSFTFFDLNPGKYDIEVSLEGFENYSNQIEIQKKDHDLEIELKKLLGNSRIYGNVFDAKNKEPINGGQIFLIRPTNNLSKPINSKTGFYEFLHLPAGFYSIWTSIIDYQEENFIVTVEEGEEKRLDFYLRKKEVEEVPWG
jgi:uncharacterized membrane protein